MTELRREQGVHTGKYREHAQKHMQTPRKMTLKLKNIEKHTEDQKSKKITANKSNLTQKLSSEESFCEAGFLMAPGFIEGEIHRKEKNTRNSQCHLSSLKI